MKTPNKDSLPSSIAFARYFLWQLETLNRFEPTDCAPHNDVKNSKGIQVCATC